MQTQEYALALLPPGDASLRKELEARLAEFRRAAASRPTTQPIASWPAIVDDDDD